MRSLSIVPWLLAITPLLAHAATIEPKALARFDVTYARCEVQIPRLRGHRDAAYLAMWSPKIHDKVRGQLVTARNGASYTAERQRIAQAAAKHPTTPKADEEECKPLMEEVQRITAAKK
jgi:hypothetical protein